MSRFPKHDDAYKDFRATLSAQGDLLQDQDAAARIVAIASKALESLDGRPTFLRGRAAIRISLASALIAPLRKRRPCR